MMIRCQCVLWCHLLSTVLFGKHCTPVVSECGCSTPGDTYASHCHIAKCQVHSWLPYHKIVMQYSCWHVTGFCMQGLICDLIYLL